MLRILLPIGFLILAGCAQEPTSWDGRNDECRRQTLEFLDGPYSKLTPGAEKLNWGTNRSQPRIFIPSDWSFPARLEALGGDPNLTIPDPDSVKTPQQEAERKRLYQVSHERFSRWLRQNISDDRPSVQLLEGRSWMGYALVNVSNAADAQWLLDEPYVANVYNYERSSRELTCAM